MKTSRLLATLTCVLCTMFGNALAQFAIATGTSSTTQNFDRLISTLTNQLWTNDTTLAPADSTLIVSPSRNDKGKPRKITPTYSLN